MKARESKRIEWIALIRNWLHQGLSYMRVTEIMFRLMLELLFISLCTILFPLDFVESMFLGHTIMWICFSNFWASVLFAIPNLYNPGRDKTLLFLNRTASLSLKFTGVKCVLLYGSISRGKWHSQSDLDMRILYNNTFLGTISGLMFVYFLRGYAFLKRQPLDLFGTESLGFLDKMRADETPLCLAGECPVSVKSVAWKDNIL